MLFDQETTRLLERAYRGGDASKRRRRALDALDLCEGDRAVDIGCGNGLLTEEIARAIGAGGRVIGVDPSDDMRAAAVRRCAEHPGAEIVAGVAAALPVADGWANKAVSIQVLEYLTDIPAAIAEVHRVLRPGGKFVAIDTSFQTLHWFSDDKARMARMLAAWDQHYADETVAARWSGLMRDAGFIASEVSAHGFCDVHLRPDGIANLLMHSMKRFAVQGGHVAAEEAQAWFDEQRELARSGRFFFSLTYCLMSAIRP